MLKPLAPSLYPYVFSFGMMYAIQLKIYKKIQLNRSFSRNFYSFPSNLPQITC